MEVASTSKEETFYHEVAYITTEKDPFESQGLEVRLDYCE